MQSTSSRRVANYAAAAEKMAQNLVQRNHQLLEQAVKAFLRHDFQAFWVETKEEARDRVLELISPQARVGIGGTWTIRQVGLVEALASRGNPVVEHWKSGLSYEEDLALRRAELGCDVFLSSANAVTLEGELINIDGAGNRVAALAFGPPKVVVVAGVNKLAGDIPEGLKRARNVAASLRAQSLGSDAPCAHTGVCNDCSSPKRVCRVITITERRPLLTDYTVVLVNEQLGF